MCQFLMAKSSSNKIPSKVVAIVQARFDEHASNTLELGMKKNLLQISCNSQLVFSFIFASSCPDSEGFFRYRTPARQCTVCTEKLGLSHPANICIHGNRIPSATAAV